MLRNDGVLGDVVKLVHELQCYTIWQSSENILCMTLSYYHTSICKNDDSVITVYYFLRSALVAILNQIKRDSDVELYPITTF